MKRTPLKRGSSQLKRSSGLKRTGKVNPVSAKTRKRNAVYSEQAKAHKLRVPFCEYPGCGKATTDTHHRESRAQAPDRVTDPENFIGLCSWHHTLITNDPDHGKELGLSVVSSYELRHTVVNTKGTTPNGRSV